MTEKVKRIDIVAHEKPWQSMFNDVVTFGFLIGTFWVNDAFLNSAVPDWVLAGLFVLFAFAKFSQMVGGSIKKVTSPQEAKAALEEVYGPLDEL